MDLYHTTDTDGISELRPNEARMRALIASLDDPDTADSDHPDISLIHDPSGWALGVYPNGIVTWENLDQNEDRPRYMSGVSRNEALKLWQELSRGQIDSIHGRPWLRDEV